MDKFKLYSLNISNGVASNTLDLAKFHFHKNLWMLIFSLLNDYRPAYLLLSGLFQCRRWKTERIAVKNLFNSLIIQTYTHVCVLCLKFNIIETSEIHIAQVVNGFVWTEFVSITWWQNQQH